MSHCNARSIKPKPFVTSSGRKIKTEKVGRGEPAEDADGSFRRSPVRVRPAPVYKEESDTEEDSVSVSSYGSNNSRW